MTTLGKSTFLWLGLALTASAGIAIAQKAAELDPAVAARQAQMRLVGYHTGILGAMAKGEREYDAELARLAATNLNTAASFENATMWIEGTEQGVAEGTRAKAEIWSDSAGFAEKYDQLGQASAAMIDAAGTDLDALKAAMGDLGGACKACHEDYRGPENK
ncbi:c-type cytochrome [Sulfitobacter aestuarii]|uniref:C-type cytochrome n=1 Tax=Sulfitobacter aestuarii TaxID=2161676 RepID=A0ABW5U0M8_9RHOB